MDISGSWNGKHVLVLLSGGLDSAACIAYYASLGYTVSGLYLEYGQLAAGREAVAARAISAHYGIALREVLCSGFRVWAGGYVVGRNALLLYSGLMAFEHETGIIAVGIHSGGSYVDCSEQFVKCIQASFDLYTDGRVAIDAPFLGWNKREIWDYCLSQKVPVGLTYSCELGREQPCGECMSCKDLEVLHAGKE